MSAKEAEEESSKGKKRKESMKRWLLKVGYYYPEENYRDTLEVDVKLFRSKEVAVKMLQETIRSDWTCEVDTSDGVKALADCRGMEEEIAGEPAGKYASWSYSEDGCLAWCFFSDGHGYKGEVVEVEVPND